MGADALAARDLVEVGADEQRDADAGRRQLRHDARQALAVADDIEAALGRALRPALRHQANGAWRQATGDRRHLIGRGHFEIQRQ
jgi:hypothetical protein